MELYNTTYHQHFDKFLFSQYTIHRYNFKVQSYSSVSFSSLLLVFLVYKWQRKEKKKIKKRLFFSYFSFSNSLSHRSFSNFIVLLLFIFLNKMKMKNEKTRKNKFRIKQHTRHMNPLLFSFHFIKWCHFLFKFKSTVKKRMVVYEMW